MLYWRTCYMRRHTCTVMLQRRQRQEVPRGGSSWPSTARGHAALHMQPALPCSAKQARPCSQAGTWTHCSSRHAYRRCVNVKALPCLLLGRPTHVFRIQHPDPAKALQTPKPHGNRQAAGALQGQQSSEAWRGGRRPGGARRRAVQRRLHAAAVPGQAACRRRPLAGSCAATLPAPPLHLYLTSMGTRALYSRWLGGPM